MWSPLQVTHTHEVSLGLCNDNVYGYHSGYFLEINYIFGTFVSN